MFSQVHTAWYIGREDAIQFWKSTRHIFQTILYSWRTWLMTVITVQRGILQICYLSFRIENNSVSHTVFLGCIFLLQFTGWKCSFFPISYIYIYIYMYLSGFDKMYLQKFLATVSFEACSLLDHSCFFLIFFLMILSVQKSP